MLPVMVCVRGADLHVLGEKGEKKSVLIDVFQMI